MNMGPIDTRLGTRPEIVRTLASTHDTIAAVFAGQ